MILLVTVEARFVRDANGNHWVKSPTHYDFFIRYLDSFEKVVVVARVTAAKGAGAEEGFLRVDGPGVEVVRIPDYRGAAGFLRAAVQMVCEIRTAVTRADAMLLRVPGNVAWIVWLCAGKALRQNSAVEVVGDPWDVFSPGAIDHPLRRIFRVWFAASQAVMVRNASCAAYVTRSYLQQRYPAGDSAFVANYSSASIESQTVTLRPRTPPRTTLEVVTVGSLDQPYKDVGTVLRAVKQASGEIDIHLVVVGGGVLQGELEGLCTRLGLDERVSFLGQLPPAEVRRTMDRAHVLVSASRTEGIARAALEAMARGMPVVSTPVGGMREIIHEGGRFPVADEVSLARLLLRLRKDPAFYEVLAGHSSEVVQGFTEESLGPKRSAFYQELRTRSAQGPSSR